MKTLEIYTVAFINALAKFKERLQVQGVSKDQQYSKPNGVKEFLHYLETKGKTQLTQITQRVVNNYLEYLKTRPLQTKEGYLSTGSLMKHRESILRFIEFIQKVGQGKSSIKIKSLKNESKPKQILLENEVQELFNVCDDTLLGIRDKAILSLLYGCGLRRKEVLNLTTDAIDLNRNRIHIKTSKTGYGREVVMSKTVKVHIEDYIFNVRNLMLDAHTDLQELLITERGTSMSNSALTKVMDRLNSKTTTHKKVTCHLLRHTIGTHLHRYLSLQDVAKFLGHRNLDSTMIYTHLKAEYYG